MGAENSKTRFSEAITLLNYGFSKCYIYQDTQVPQLEPIKIENGKQDTIECKYEKEFSYMFMDKINDEDITRQSEINTQLAAPINEGDIVGKLMYYYKNEKIGEVNIIATQSVQEATFVDSLIKIVKKLSFN